MLRPDYSIGASEQLQKLSSVKKRLALDVIGPFFRKTGDLLRIVKIQAL